MFLSTVIEITLETACGVSFKIRYQQTSVEVKMQLNWCRTSNDNVLLQIGLLCA